MKAAVGSLPQDRVAPRFLLAAASDITTSDVDLAFASEAIILGFNQEPSEAVLAAAKQYGARACLLPTLDIAHVWLWEAFFALASRTRAGVALVSHMHAGLASTCHVPFGDAGMCTQS